MSNTGKSYGKKIVFAVITLALLCYLALAANVVAPINERETALAAATDGIVHGAVSSQTTSGTAIANSTDFYNNIINGAQNGTYYLTSDFTLDGSHMFVHKSKFSGTLYGNGHTITVLSGYNAARKTEKNGILFSQVSGTVRDLTVVLGNGGSTAQRIDIGDGNTGYYGVITGALAGGTISNCRVVIQSNVVFHAATQSSGTQNVGIGGIAGEVWNSASKILNCTVENYGAIDCTTYSGSYTSYNGRSGYAGHIAGIFWLANSDTATLQNIIVRGNGRIHANGVGVVGCGSEGGYNDLDITNYLNDFSGSYEDNNGAGAAWASDAIFFYSSNSNRTIYNYYSTSGATSTSWSNSTDAAESGRLTLSSGYNIYFDATSDVNNAVAFVYNGSYDVITKKLYFQPANSSTKYYPAYRDGNTEVFKGLPSATSTYSATLGTFAFDTVEPPVGKLNKWESGYVSESYSPSGEPEDSESGLYDAISNNRNCHLTSDINITGFRTLSYSGTLDGNGHTIYITVCNENSAETVGGLFGTLTGTVKNLRVVLYVDYTRTATSNKLGTGIIAGKLGGTVDNVYVYIPSNVTFGATGSQEGYVGAVAGVADGTSYTIKNTTVDIDGKIHLDGSWVYMAGFVGKSATGSSAVTATYTNNILKGDGSYSSNTSNGTEPIYLAATTVLFQAGTGNPQSTINIDGFINAFTSGTANLNDYSMYGVLTKNDNGKTMSKWTNNVSNVYDYDGPMADVNNKGTSTGNNYIDVSQKRSTVSTEVDSYAIGVTPYFPAGDTDNLVLVAGNGTVTVPDLVYGNHTSAADGNYKVVTIPKSAITAPTTVILTEPITPANPIADLNQWEHGYVAEPIAEEGVPEDCEAVSTAWKLKTAIGDNSNIVLTSDIRNFRGFTHTGTYSGILDGNGHTIYIVKASAASGNNIGGLFSTLSGTIKNVRIVVMAGVNLPSSNYVGAVAGALSGNAKVNNVSVIINSGVSLISTISGGAGGAGGIAGGLISGAGTVAISNSTVELNGELNATAKWTFIGGFVGHLNGGNINFTDVIFKGTGALNGTASGREGVHTAAVAVIGGGVQTVTLDGLINAFTGTKTSNKSAYAITFVRNGSNVATPTISHVYTYGGNFSNEGSMTYGTPVDVSAIKAEIKTTVDGESTPVTPYFPASDKEGKLYLVAGDGATAAGVVVYGTTPSTAAGAGDKYSLITIAKTTITAGTTVTLTRPRVSAPTIFGSDSKTYNGFGQEFQINELTATGGITLGASDYTLAFAVEADTGALLDGSGKPLNAGRYTLTVTLTGYLFEAGGNTATLTVYITKLAINATIDTASKVYGEDDPALNFTTDGLVGADKKDALAVTLTRAYGNNAGNYAITGESDAINYTVTFTNDGAELFTITARPIEVTISAVSKVYGVTTDPALTFTFDEEELQYSDTADALGVTLTRDSGKNAGSYAISGTSSSANYAVTFTNSGEKLFTINKRPLHYVLSVKNMNGNATDGYSLEYGAFSATANLAASIVSGEGYYAVVADESVTVTPKLPGEVKNVGTYTINAIDAAYGETTSIEVVYGETTSAGNYDITLDNTVSFEIVAKAVTVDISSYTKTYGEANPVFQWSLAAGFDMAYDENKTMLDVTLSLSGDGENVGDYAITGECNNPNYAVTFVDGTLTVNKRAITVTLKQDFSSVYGESLAEVTVDTALTLAGGSLAPAHSDLEAAGFSVSFSSGGIRDAKVYEGVITASCSNANYSVTWTDGKQSADYTVKARPLKYSVTLSGMQSNEDGYFIYYGDFKNSMVTISPVTGDGYYAVVAGETVTVSAKFEKDGNDIAEVKDVGAYSVIGITAVFDAASGAKESNYTVTVEVAAPGAFIIEKRPVNIILSSQTKNYGDDDPETLGEWSLSANQPEGGGMAYNEAPSAVITVTDVSYGDNKDKGVYPLTATATSANYTVTVVAGSMEIKAKEVTVTITSAEKTYGEDDPLLYEWSHTGLAYGEPDGSLGFTVTREEGEDVKEGGYALSGTATNVNYEVTVKEGSVLTINPLEISFTVTNAQLPYNKYTADKLPDPAGLGAAATPSLTTLPYGDTVKVTFTYNTDKTAIVSEPKGEYDYIKTEITFLKSDGTTSADDNYTVTGEVKCMLVVVSGDLIINLDAYSKTYDFAAGGITLSLSSVKVTVASGATVTPVISAKILSSDGATEYFVSADGKVVISYVPSADKTETSVNLKFVVTAEAEEYEPGSAEMTITVSKADYDLTGITFEGKTAGYDGTAHEITYTGTLPEGLTAEVTHTGDNVNYTEAGAEFTLTFDLTGEEQNENIYYSYNLPAARTALLTIEKAPVTITVNPQSSVYNGRTPAASAVAGTDYDITGTVYAPGGVLDDLGVKLTINGGAQAVNAGEYPLTVSISNANYELTAVNSLYTIEKRPVYIVLTSDYASKVYGDADPDWSQVSLAVEPYDTGESGTGLVGGDGINELKIIKVTRAEGEAAGAYAVTVECDEGGNYYADESRLDAFNIASRPLTVILNKDAFVSVYGEALVLPDPDDENQLKLKDGFALVGEEAGKPLSEAGFRLYFNDGFEGAESAGHLPAGTYTNAVRLSAINGNYAVTFEGNVITADYVVTKRPVWITVTPVTVEYGDSGELKFELSGIQPEKGGLAWGETADDIGITLTREGGDRPAVGKYNIDCIVGENSNYDVSVMNSPEVVYEVTAREIKIIINDAEKTYGDETPVFTWEMAEGYTMAYDDDETALGIALMLADGAAGVDAGSYTITGTSSALGNYLVIFENATFTVHKKQAVIDVGGVKVEYVYTGLSFRITEGASHDNTDVESATSQLKYPDKEFLNVSDSGEYKITIGATKNFLAAEATITVTIAKATVVFDWSSVEGQEYVYDGTFRYVTGVTVNVYGAAVEYANNTFTDVPEGGVLNVTVSVAETENIIGASETREIPVLRATIDVSGLTFVSREYIFDATEKALTVSGTLPWGIEGVKYAGNALTEAGTTEAVAEFVYNANNFNAVENMNATLTITPRPVAIELESAVKVFGEEDPAYTFALAAEQPCEGTDKVLAMWALDAVVARDPGEDAGKYALSLTGYDPNYSAVIVSEGSLTITPREIVFAVTGVFESVYDGNEKEVNVNEAFTVAGGSLAPVHADIAASGAVSVSVAEGVSIIDAGVYENAIVFTLVGGNYAASFEGVSENVMTADYTVTRREITVKLRDQRLLKEESIDSKAYDVTAGTLVKGDDLGITISQGDLLGVDRYELVAEYTNLNYAVAFESGVLVYTVRAVITAVTPEDFLYTGEPFAIDVTINSTAPLVFYVNGEYAANNFVEPGHYVVTISASADDTYREPLNVTVIFNILAPEIKHEEDGAEISVSTETGFYPEDSFEIIREQGRENSTIAEMISGEYTIVDGYVLNVSTAGGTVTLGEYIRNNAGEDLVVRIKVPEEYANSATVECVIIRSGEASMETVDVKDGYIEIAAKDVEAVAFIAERETLIAVIIIAAAFAIAMLLLGCFYVFRNKAY